MNIQFSDINFVCRPAAVQFGSRKPFSAGSLKTASPLDTFTRTTLDINKDLWKIRLGDKINGGCSAEVYKTNFDGYVIRLKRGKKFDPEKLKPLEDPNGLIVAADDDDFIRLMKFVKGNPLYGKDWKLFSYETKEEYLKEFHKIAQLPDETFAQYIRDVLKIRENGYDIDIINPNNYLLDGNHIGIVDLKKDNVVMPDIDVWDFDPLVNKSHLLAILNTMDKQEKVKFAEEIKNFYDRIIEIAKKEGLQVTEPVLYSDRMNDENVTAYLYYKRLDMLDELIYFWLKVAGYFR